MRPAGRRKIMKVALRVKKVGQHCSNMSFEQSVDQGRAQTDDGDESTGEHVDSTINSSDLEKRCRRPGTHCPRST